MGTSERCDAYCRCLSCPQVINSRTAKFHFGHGFSEQYEDPYVLFRTRIYRASLTFISVRYGHEINRQKPVFARTLQSFVQTIRPNAHNARLIRAARAEIASLLSMPHPPTREGEEPEDAEASLTRHNPDPYIAVHIRRGDRHASSFPYRGSYVPIDHFVSATQDAWTRLYNNGSSSTADATHYPSPPITYVASDSPSATEEFMGGFSTSTAVFSLESSTDPELRALVSQHEYVQSEFEKQSEEDRVRLTRGMVVDFALLSGLWAWEGEVVPGATVCTMSYVLRCIRCRSCTHGLFADPAFAKLLRSASDGTGPLDSGTVQTIPWATSTRNAGGG